MTCTFPEPADFDVHYVLPHFHGLGTSFALQAVGGTRDGAMLHESAGALGEAWGKMLEPPVPIGGATAIRVTCGYDNPRETEVRYGFGDKDVCVSRVHELEQEVWRFFGRQRPESAYRIQEPYP